MLFANPWLLLAGWVHYLAFDLLVGAWEARDARMRGVPRWALVPCLALTFMLGPAGWLLYLGVRAASRLEACGSGCGVSRTVDDGRRTRADHELLPSSASLMARPMGE